MSSEDWEKVRISPVTELKNLKIGIGGFENYYFDYMGKSIQSFTAFQTGENLKIENFSDLNKTNLEQPPLEQNSK